MDRLLHFDRVDQVSNIILTTNMLTLMVRHIFDILGRVRSLTLTAEVCTYIYTLLNSAARSQSIFALSSPMFIKVCFSGANE